MAKKIKKSVKLEEIKEVAEDRSSFNCPACLGEGLDSKSKLCPQCLGTGKI